MAPPGLEAVGRVGRVILIGMMGSGKSTVGRLLSEATGWPYHDNDDLVRRLFQATPRQILAAVGEARLRDAESRALALGLESPAPCIIGAAAGTILDETNRDRLRDAGTVVWLRATAATLEQRAMGAEHRPWIDARGADWVRATVAERDPLYASVAAVTIDVDEQSAQHVAGQILGRLTSVG